MTRPVAAPITTLTVLDECDLTAVTGGDDPAAAREAREALEEFLQRAQRYFEQQYGV